MGGAAGQATIANMVRAVKGKFEHPSPLTCEKVIDGARHRPKPLVSRIQPDHGLITQGEDEARGFDLPKGTLRRRASHGVGSMPAGASKPVSRHTALDHAA